MDVAGYKLAKGASLYSITSCNYTKHVDYTTHQDNGIVVEWVIIIMLMGKYT